MASLFNATSLHRNAMTLFANVLVYGIAWVLFHKDSKSQWSSNDAPQFMVTFYFPCILDIHHIVVA